MTKHWDCKLRFKEEDEPEIDLLDYVNLLEQEEEKIPKNSSYPNFRLYKFPDRFNDLKDWPKLKKDIRSSGMANGCSLMSNDVKNLACGKKYLANCHRYRTYKEKVNVKRKYDEGSDYMVGIVTTTMKQNRLVDMRGPTGPKQYRKTQTVLPTCKYKRCNFGFNVTCRSTDGAWFLSKSGSGREHTDHPQDLNLLTSTTNMGDATRKLIQSCSRASANPSTAMRLAHLVPG
jgi:hypothetical protein